MRQIINISLPKEMALLVRQEVKTNHFASTSEFFRDLLRTWQTNKLARELRRGRKEFEDGKGILLHSLKDLR